MIPGGGADKVLDDLSLYIGQGRNVLGVLVGQVGRQSLKVEMDMALTGLGFQGVWVRHDKIAQAVDHGVEHVGGHDTVAQQVFLNEAATRQFCRAPVLSLV